MMNGISSARLTFVCTKSSAKHRSAIRAVSSIDRYTSKIYSACMHELSMYNTITNTKFYAHVYTLKLAVAGLPGDDISWSKSAVTCCRAVLRTCVDLQYLMIARDQEMKDESKSSLTFGLSRIRPISWATYTLYVRAQF